MAVCKRCVDMMTGNGCFECGLWADEYGCPTNMGKRKIVHNQCELCGEEIKYEIQRTI